MSEEKAKENNWLWVAAGVAVLTVCLLYKETHPTNTARKTLKSHYLSQATISLLVSDNEIPIDAIYTELVIIGNEDIDKKKAVRKKTRPGEDLNTLQDGRSSSSDAIFHSAERIKLENLFQRGRAEKVLIQGDPGVGKSTLCHRIAYEWARGKLFSEFELVFWLRLRRLNQPGHLTLADYLHSECRIDKELVDKVLKRKENILILLDGYDELPSANAPKDGNYRFILNELKQFPNVIITSRPYTTVNKFTPTLHLEITGFDEKGIQHYIQHFFLNKPQQRVDALNTQLKKPLVKSLAHVPINLEIFCSLAEADMPFFMDESSYTMSSLYMQLTSWLFTRFKIDRQHVDAMLARKSRDPRHTPEVDTVAQLLEELAWKAMEQKTTHLPVEEIEDIANKQHLSTKQLEDVGFFSLTSAEGAFAHLTFQEYFAAGYLAHLYVENPEKARQILQAIKFNPSYRWVLCMTAGYFSFSLNSDVRTQQQPFFNDLFAQPYDLAGSYELDLIARCFEECKDPNIIRQYPHFFSAIAKVCDNPLNERLTKELLKSHKVMSDANLMTIMVEQWQKGKRDLMSLLTDDRYALAGDRRLSLLEYADTIFSDPKQPPLHRIVAAKFFVKLIRKNQVDSFDGLSPLYAQFSNTTLDVQARELAAQCLHLSTQTAHHLAPEAFHPLLTMLSDPSLDKRTRKSVAQITDRLIRANRSLETHILQHLISLATNTSLSFPVRAGALKTISYTVPHNQHVGSNMIDLLTLMLSDSTATVEMQAALVKTLSRCVSFGHSPHLPPTLEDLLSRMVANTTLDLKFRASATSILLKDFSFNLNLEGLKSLFAIAQDKTLPIQDRVHGVSIIVATYSHWSETRPLNTSQEDLFRQSLDGLMSMALDTSLDELLRGTAARAVGKMARVRKKDGGISIVYKKDAAFDCLLQALLDMNIPAFDRQQIAKDIAHLSSPHTLHDHLASIALDASHDLVTRRGAISAINEIIVKPPHTKLRLFPILHKLFSDTSLSSQIRSEVAIAISNALKDEHRLDDYPQLRLEETYALLFSILTDTTLNREARSNAINTIGRIVQWGHPMEPNVLRDLETMVLDSTLDGHIRCTAAEVFGYAAAELGAINPEIPSSLLNMILDPPPSYPTTAPLMTTMGHIAQIDGAVGVDAFRKLIQLSLDPSTFNFQRLKAIDILHNFSASHFANHSNLNTEQLIALCSISGRAFAYSETGIHLVDQFEQVPLPNLHPSVPQLYPLIQRAEEWRH